MGMTVMPVAALDAATALPDALIDQFVKPAEGQQALLDGFRLTALLWVEQHVGHSLQRRAFRASLPAFCGEVYLPRVPVRSITLVTLRTPDAVATDVTSQWEVSGDQLVAALGWPAPLRRLGNLTIAFEAGYDDLAAEAPGLQVAALMLVKHLYDGGSVDDVPATVKMLLDQLRTPVMA